jgi:hypothetical protein
MYGTLIASVTAGAGGAASLGFTSIPNTYTDLIVVFSARATNAGNDTWTINGTTGQNYNAIYASSASASYYQGTNDTGRSTSSSSQASNFGAKTIYIVNYASSVYKPYSVNASAADYNGGFIQNYGGVWANTAAITSLTFAPAGATFAQYSTIYLYGILKGTGGATAA